MKGYVQYRVYYGGRFDFMTIYVQQYYYDCYGERDALVETLWDLLNQPSVGPGIQNNVASARILRRMGRRWDKDSLKKMFRDNLQYDVVHKKENRYVSSS